MRFQFLQKQVENGRRASEQDLLSSGILKCSCVLNVSSDRQGATNTFKKALTGFLLNHFCLSILTTPEIVY